MRRRPFSRLARFSLLARLAPLAMLVAAGSDAALAVERPPSSLEEAASELTLDVVLARHREAKGGLEKLRAVESLKASGRYTSFSEVSPFTLYRKRPDKMLFDHRLGSKKAVFGCGAGDPWWINLWYEVDFAMKMPAVDARHLCREARIGGPLLDPEGHGAEIALVGPGEVDGEPAIELTATYADGAVERWFLDPESSLEMARIGPTADFGREVEGRTWFSDFREVAGAKLPFYVESEFDIRHRVLEIDAIEVNPELDDALFAMPVPAAMRPLAPLAGQWKVKIEQRPAREEAPWRESAGASTIESLAHGGLLAETFAYEAGDGTPVELRRQFSHDVYKDRYRVTAFVDWDSHLRVFEGALADGRLALTDLETGTAAVRPGRDTTHRRITVSAIGDDGFTLETETSTDAGETWTLVRRYTYAR